MGAQVEATADGVSSDLDRVLISTFDSLQQRLTQHQEKLRTILFPSAPPASGTAEAQPTREQVRAAYDDSIGLYRVFREAVSGVGVVKELLEVRHTNVRLQTELVNSLPIDERAQLLTYISLGVFGAGGISFGLSGFPSDLTRALPSILIWLVGFGLLVYSVVLLWCWQDKKWRFYEERLGVKVFNRNGSGDGRPDGSQRQKPLVPSS